MLKLCNFSNYPDQLKLFQTEGVNHFLTEHHLDGVEMLFGQEWNCKQLPRKRIKGVHLPVYGSWLDFWREDRQALAQNFGTLQQAYDYYGGARPEVLVNKYCKAVQQAVAVGAHYVVFHVSHVRPQEVFNYRFKATDEQVIRAAGELLNAVFRRIDSGICLLLENLWWPGLTLRSKTMASLLLSLVEHANKGFMLDTGHLMNTCTQLDSQQAGIKYIMSTLDGLGSMVEYIRGIHLHYSLSGAYVRCVRRDGLQLINLSEVLGHIFKIDQHLPFCHIAAGQILEYVRPEYLVHEFMYSSRQQLSEYLNIQNKALEGGNKR